WLEISLPQPIHPAIQVVHEPQLVVLVLAERGDGAVAGCSTAGQRGDLQLAGAGETADQQFAGAGVGEDVSAPERDVGATVDDAAGDRAAALLAAGVLEHRGGGAGPGGAIAGAGGGVVVAALAVREAEVARCAVAPDADFLAVLAHIADPDRAVGVDAEPPGVAQAVQPDLAAFAAP